MGCSGSKEGEFDVNRPGLLAPQQSQEQLLELDRRPSQEVQEQPPQSCPQAQLPSKKLSNEPKELSKSTSTSPPSDTTSVDNITVTLSTEEIEQKRIVRISKEKTAQRAQ